MYNPGLRGSDSLDLWNVLDFLLFRLVWFGAWPILFYFFIEKEDFS